MKKIFKWNDIIEEKMWNNEYLNDIKKKYWIIPIFNRIYYHITKDKIDNFLTSCIMTIEKRK